MKLAVEDAVIQLKTNYLLHMWLTKQSGYDSKQPFAVRQSREYIIPGEGQKNHQRTRDVIYIKDSPRDSISCTVIHEEMFVSLRRANICSVRHRRRHQVCQPQCVTVCIRNSSLKRPWNCCRGEPCPRHVDRWHVTWRRPTSAEILQILTSNRTLGEKGQAGLLVDYLCSQSETKLKQAEYENHRFEFQVWSQIKSSVDPKVFYLSKYIYIF